MFVRYTLIALGTAVTATLLMGCEGPANGSEEQSGATLAQVSPWDSLSAEEIEEVATAIKQRHGDGVLFNRISLSQPEKVVALQWQPDQKAVRGAAVSFRAEGKTHHVSYDFSRSSLAPTQTYSSGQPMLTSDGEMSPAVAQINENEALLAALARRAIEPGDGLCLPRTTGRFFSDIADPVNDRLLRIDCFYIKGQGGLGVLPSTAAFARPIEGLSVLYDLEKKSIIEITDSYPEGGYPPHDIAVIEYQDGALETRASLRPLAVTRPQGLNFTVSGDRIDWQGWQFYLRFDPRQGTILNRVGHLTPEGFRSVAYEVAMSEMFVPYYDTDAHWFYRAYFDMGEYGLGNMATELKGSDCPTHAVYKNVTLHGADGTPREMPNRICIFEHDPGFPIWRHHESLYDDVPGMDNHQSRSAMELVVRMVATIGNYDYFQDYVFGQDGRLRVRLVATGIDATKGVLAASMADPSANADTATGTLIAPHLVGVNHDHFFGYRIDMDVDGTTNNFQRHKLRAVAQPAQAPRQGIWAVSKETVTSELAAQTQMDVSKPALLVFASADQKNAMGNATGYQIIMPNVRPLVTLDDATHARALFVRNNLWVTLFKRDELFSAGLMVNQSAPGKGLPEFVADDETITDADVVAWPTIGFHHVPMAEDWPVMPAKVDEIILKPRNFFDRNPAIDLPQ